MKNIEKLINKFKKSKQGSMAIEIVIGLFMFLIVLCFMLDLIILAWKFSVISQVNSKVARVAGIQGGILTSAPAGFPGGDNAYTSVGELNSTLSDHFKKAGIESGEWKLYVENKQILGSGSMSQSRKIEFREPFSTKVEVTYTWNMISNFIPGSLTNSLSSTRPTMSEWKYDYNNWIGE